MKKEKKIVIKNPILRKFRSNLRFILYRAVSKELTRLYQLEKSYMEEKHPTLAKNEKRRHLSKIRDDLLRTRRSSILQCSGSHCEPFKEPLSLSIIDKDMIYDPIYKEWYCIPCYDEIQKNFDPRNWFNQGVIVRNESEKPCYYLDWCPYGSLAEGFRIRKLPNEYTCIEFDHDCPTFYVAHDISESHSNKIVVRPEGLLETLKDCAYFSRRKLNKQKFIRKEFKKPCHKLEWCPYGNIGIEFKNQNNHSKYTCKIFKYNCPVFFYGEPISEKNYKSFWGIS